MHANFNRRVEKLFIEFTKINKIAKALMYYGIRAFQVIFLFGSVIVITNHTIFDFNSYYEFLGTTIIKTSFTILAEAIIGGLVLDFIFKKQ